MTITKQQILDQIQNTSAAGKAGGEVLNNIVEALALALDLPLTYAHRGDATPDNPIVISQNGEQTTVDTYTFTLDRPQTLKVDTITRWRVNATNASSILTYIIDGVEVLTAREEVKDANNEMYTSIWACIDFEAGEHTIELVASKAGNASPNLTIFSNGWTRVPVIVEP